MISTSPSTVSSLWAAGGTGHAGGSGLTTGEAVPAGWRADFRRAFLLCLDRAAATVAVDLDADLAVWPDDVLADQTHDRFYHASGLLAQELAMLETGNPTLADLSRRFGRVWVENHIQRLCLLGLARLRTVATA